MTIVDSSSTFDPHIIDIEGVRLVVSSMVSAVRSLLAVSALVVFTFSLFGIMGVYVRECFRTQ
jgi:hypothetical protein